MTVKIRKGDKVELISGNQEEKGLQGEVIKILTEDRRAVVQGINVCTKHQRQQQVQGRTISPGKVRFEAPVSIANLMLVCPKCGKATRVAIQREGEKAVRVCKKCKALIDG